MHFPRLSLSVHAYHRVEIVWELIIVTNDIFWHKKDSLKKNKHTPASAQPTATATISRSKIENKYILSSASSAAVGSHTPPEIILYLFLIINRLGGKCRRRKNRPKARITITSSSSFLSGTAGWGNRVYCWDSRWVMRDGSDATRRSDWKIWWGRFDEWEPELYTSIGTKNIGGAPTEQLDSLRTDKSHISSTCVLM